VRTLLLTLVLGSLVAAGSSTVEAGGATGGFRRVGQSGRASYYAQVDGPNEVDVRRSEELLDRLFTLFGAPESAWHMEYYRHSSVEALSAQLGFAAYGATDTTSLRVDSVRAFHPHELVHAVTARLGQPPLLFSEGIAVALTAQGRWHDRDVDATARRWVRSGRGLAWPLQHFASDEPDTDYAVAGSFVGFLLDRYGIEPLAAFLRGCPTPEAYEGALLASYGRGLAELELDWRQALEQPAAGRAWYDTRSWPASLHRGFEARVATGPVRPPSLRERLLESAKGPKGRLALSPPPSLEPMR